MNYGRNYRRDCDPFQFREGSESPNGFIEPQAPEDDHTEDGIERSEVLPWLQVIKWNHGKAQIESQQERQEIGASCRNQIVDH